ncbi:MAG TPA: hypothetical protein VLT87_20960 [Thermoanaerobaculia bacterium]|nr:hypothetical protein [Thermoanaerobaculia bacterium]HSN87192.1 hypothetical protein [Thermoanaerobaculia bacterium]
MSFKIRDLMVDVLPERQGFGACGEATRNEGDNDECGEATRGDRYTPSVRRAADLAVLKRQLLEILG